MNKKALILLLINFITFIAIPSAWAELFHFVDKSGVIHFSNAPTDPRYRLFKGKRLASNDPNRYKESDFNKLIEEKSRRYKIDSALIKAIIRAESSFDPNAVSDAGAQGLMQLMPVTALSMDVIDPFNPNENIEGGVKYLKYLLTLFKNDLKLALAAYHAGEQNVFRHNGIPPIEQTRDYIKKVLNFYKGYGGKLAPKEKPIYKVVANDGTIVYTNKPDFYKNQRVSLIEMPSNRR